MSGKKVTPKGTIGILGGMGPAASAEFYRCIVDIAQHEYGADQDTDFFGAIVQTIRQLEKGR